MGELRPEGWLHLAARRDCHFRQPSLRQVATACLLILTDVASDVCQLECEPQVAGAVQRRFIIGLHAHEDSHHAADSASYMVTIAQHVSFRSGSPILGIESEACDEIMRIARRNGAFPHDEPKAIEGGIAGDLAA